MPMEPATPPAVRSDERAQLAEVLDRFIAGKTTISRLAWDVCDFVRSADRCVRAIAETCDWEDTVSFPFLQTIRSLTPEQQATAERCRLFLRTDLPYEWPEAPDQTLAELGQAVLMVLGMALFGYLVFGLVTIMLGQWPAGILLSAECIGAGVGVIIGYRALRHWKGERWAACTGVGDIDVWPFVRRADYGRAQTADRCGTPSAHLPSPPS